MKNLLIRFLSVAIVVAELSFSSPAFGEDSAEMLNKALDLIQQASNPKDNSGSDAQRIQSLTEALSLAQQAPSHRLKGHRVQAIQNIRDALAEIRKGDPGHKAHDCLSKAQSELKSAVSLASKNDVVTPTVSQPKASPAASIQDAAEKGDLEKVKTFLQSNPNLVFSQDDFGLTPLLAASARGHKDVVELLLTYKADVNAKDNQGLTSLHYTALSNHKEVAELLLSKGADVNAMAKHEGLWPDDTPLWIAGCNGHKDVAQVLLAHKADASIAGKGGLTPLRIAQANHHENVVELLRQTPRPATAPSAPPPSTKAAQEMIARLVANASKRPPGPVENDIDPQVVRVCDAMLKNLQKKDRAAAPSLRDSLAEDYKFFTLEGPLLFLYSNGTYGLFSAPVKLSDAKLRDFDDMLSPKDQPGFGPGMGGWMYLAEKVKADGHVTATFCFIQEQGSWKAHNIYITNNPLEDQQRKGIVDLVDSYAKKP